MSNSKKSRSIKNYLMLPSYQLRLIGFISLIMLICSFLHGTLLYYLISKKIASSFMAGHANLREIWEILQPAVIVSNGLSFVIMCVFIFLIAVLISHKLIGPMMKIEGQVRKLSAGLFNIQSIKLREGDEGVELCKSVNELQTVYKDKFLKINEIKNSLPDNDKTKDALDEVLKGIEL